MFKKPKPIKYHFLQKACLPCFLMNVLMTLFKSLIFSLLCVFDVQYLMDYLFFRNKKENIREE